VIEEEFFIIAEFFLESFVESLANDDFLSLFFEFSLLGFVLVLRQILYLS
jgi:hypothetical protein